jgi:HEAT repeat protein
MVTTLKEIVKSKTKHKEQVVAMAELALNDKKALSQIFDLLRTGSDVERGTAAEVFKFVSQEDTDLLVPYIDTLIEYIDYKAPRVRWGCPEAIGNMARKHADKFDKAIPKLLGNLNDSSTVVRWCAAYALTEIAKYNADKKAELVVLLRTLIEKENNNGVRNLYAKALKKIDGI